MHLPVPYMHAVAILIKRLSERDYPTPQRWAWMIKTCQHMLNIPELTDRVRDLSQGGVRGQLLPRYFGRPKSPDGAPTPPPNLMTMFMYCLCAVSEAPNGFMRFTQLVQHSGMFHITPVSGSLCFILEPSIDKGAEAAWAFDIMTRKSALPHMPAIIEALGAERPTLVAAAAAAVSARTHVLAAQAALTSATHAGAAALVLTGVRQDAMHHAWSPADVEAAAAALTEALLHESVAAQTLQQAVEVAAQAACAAQVAEAAVSSAEVGDILAACIRRQIQMLREHVKPIMCPLVHGLQVVEFVILSDLCRHPHCIYSSLPCSRPAGAYSGQVFWPQATPDGAWQRQAQARASYCRWKLHMKVNEVDPLKYAHWVRSCTSNTDLFLNPTFGVGNGGTGTAVIVTHCMSPDGMAFVAGSVSTLSLLPLRWQSRAAAHEFVQAHMAFMLQHRPGVITAGECVRLLDVVVSHLCESYCAGTPTLSGR